MAIVPDRRLFILTAGMKIIAKRVDTGLVAAILLVVLLNKELPAFGAILVNWLKVANKIAVGIPCTPVKFLAAAPGFSGNNIP